VLEIVSLGVWEVFRARKLCNLCVRGLLRQSVKFCAQISCFACSKRSHGLGPSRPIRWQAGGRLGPGTASQSGPFDHVMLLLLGWGVCVAAIMGNPRSTEKFVLFPLCATEKSVLGGI